MAHAVPMSVAPTPFSTVRDGVRNDLFADSIVEFLVRH